MTACEYYAGNPRDGASQCGAEAQRGSPYCPEHHALCHQTYCSDDKREATRRFRAQHLRLLAAKSLRIKS